VLSDPLSLLLSIHFRGLLWQLSFAERWSLLWSPLPLVPSRSSSHSHLDFCRCLGKPYCSIASLWPLLRVLPPVAKWGMFILFFTVCSGRQQFRQLDSSVWASLVSRRKIRLNYHRTTPATPPLDFPSQIHSLPHARFHPTYLSPQFLNVWPLILLTIVLWWNHCVYATGSLSTRIYLCLSLQNWLLQQAGTSNIIDDPAIENYICTKLCCIGVHQSTSSFSSKKVHRTLGMNDRTVLYLASFTKSIFISIIM